MKMNKKGFQLLSETTLKILIAVICIGFLVYLGYKIYDSVYGNEDVKKAQTFVKELESKINAFKSSDLTEMTYMGFPPAGWYLKSFDIAKEGHPANQCVGKFTSCLCICSVIDCSGKLYSCKGFKDSVVIDYTYNEKVRMAVPVPVPPTYDNPYSGIIKLEMITELKVIKQSSVIRIIPNPTEEGAASGSAAGGDGGGGGGGF